MALKCACEEWRDQWPARNEAALPASGAALEYAGKFASALLSNLENRQRGHSLLIRPFSFASLHRNQTPETTERIATDAAGRSANAGWMLLILLYVPLFSSTVLAKFSFPPFNGLGLGIGIPLTLAATMIGLTFGAFVVDTTRLLTYLFFVSYVAAIQIFGALPFSLSSIALLALIFFPCIFRLSAQPHRENLTEAAVLRIFSKLSTIFAFLGIAQYGLQFLVGSDIAFPIEHFLPDTFLLKSFNYLNILSYGSNTYKSNGVFFLEASFFSQFMALSLLLELSLWSRLSRIGLYLVALILTFSGTGMITLAVGLTALIISKRRTELAAAVVVVALVVLLLAEPLQLNFFINRINEFQSQESSGFQRFIAWIYMFQEYWLDDPRLVFLGIGAGTFASHAASLTYTAAEMSFSKILFEFGVVGGLLYFGFQLQMIFKSTAPLAFRFGVATTLFLNGAYTIQEVALLLTLFAWPISPAAVDTAKAGQLGLSTGRVRP